MTSLSSIGYRIQTKEDLQARVPAAFSNSISPILTDRYSKFSTEEFLSTFEKLGWSPYSGRQIGMGPHARHIIRMHNPDMGFFPVKGDKIRPQLILDNSHNGYSKAQIHLGAFRLVCENGLVLAVPGLSTNVKFLHIGVNQAEMMEMIAETSEQYRTIGDKIGEMQSIKVSDEQKQEFSIAAIAHRNPRNFINEDGTINAEAVHKVIDIRDIYEPVRPQDESDDLWTLYNVVQERTVKGLFESKNAKGKKVSARIISNARRNLDYNKKLWTLMEDYASEGKLV
jgi:hypothetical protein